MTPRRSETTKPSMVRVRSVCGPAGSALAAWLDAATHRRSSWPTAVRPLDRIVVAADPAAPADLTLPPGPARAEAVAIRAMRAGAVLDWQQPQELHDATELIDLCRDRGSHSVEIVRDQPVLLRDLQLGTWTEAGWRTRALRRIAARPLASPVLSALAGRSSEQAVGLAADLAFWSGVRQAASAAEWRRFTRSYVVLNYHRISDDRKPDQELIDVPPAHFAAQVRMLKRLRFRPLTPAEQDAAHSGKATLPRRGYVVAADDGFLDCTEPLRAAYVQAQLLVPTADVGTCADTAWHRDHPTPGWGVDGEPLADWDRLRDIESDGVLVGGHGRRHTALPELPDDELAAQLRGSRADLRRELVNPIDVMAYPHGLHDPRVRDAARDAGFALAYTTQFGRNGAGTDPWCLRRVPIFRDDGLPTVLWKVITGEPLPPAVAALMGKVRAAVRVAGRPSRAAVEETTRGRRALARIVGVDEARLHAVIEALDAARLDPVLAGGWGVDALIGRATRRHLDLDIVVTADADEQRVMAALTPLGYRLRERIDSDGVAFCRRWVLRDRVGHCVDVLPVGESGPFVGDWRTTGRLGRTDVACLSLAAQHAARAGYPWRAEDHEAVRLLATDRGAS